MGLLHLMTVRTLCQRRFEQMIVRTPGAGTPLGMSSLWIWHYTTPRSRLAQSGTQRQTELGRILWAFGPEIYCFLNQSCFNRARGAKRGSLACLSHRHSS